MRSTSLMAHNKKKKNSESKNAKYANLTENTNEKMIF